jgi:hypothetical protein
MTWITLVFKYLAESAWCYRRVPEQDRRRRASAALRSGLIRLLGGRAVMLLVVSAPGIVRVPEPWLYAAIVVARAVLWSVMAEILDPQATELRTFVKGHSPRDLAWRAGGVVISCLCDVPALTAGAWVGDLLP